METEFTFNAYRDPNFLKFRLSRFLKENRVFSLFFERFTSLYGEDFRDSIDCDDDFDMFIFNHTSKPELVIEEAFDWFVNNNDEGEFWSYLSHKWEDELYEKRYS